MPRFFQDFLRFFKIISVNLDYFRLFQLFFDRFREKPIFSTFCFDQAPKQSNGLWDPSLTFLWLILSKITFLWLVLSKVTLFMPPDRKIGGILFLSCPSVLLSVCLSVYLSVCLSVCLSFCLSVTRFNLGHNF